MTRLRYNVSRLNCDLYRVGVKADPRCACGYPCENSYHFMIECPFYQECRQSMISSLDIIVKNKVIIDYELMLNGSVSLTLLENQSVFKAVQKFILSY